MAETAKILNPTKTVLLPDLRAGCSLADSVDRRRAGRAARRAAQGVPRPRGRRLRQHDRGGEGGSRRLLHVLERGADRRGAAERAHPVRARREPRGLRPAQTQEEIIAWNGNCYVHHQITPEQHRGGARGLPNVQVLAHPECRADVLALADAVLVDQRHGRLRARRATAQEFLDRHRVRALRPAAARGAGEEVLQGVQALPVHEDDHARGDARRRCDAWCTRDRRSTRTYASRAERALRRMLELG